MWVQDGHHVRPGWATVLVVAASCAALPLAVMLSARGLLAAHRARLERRHRADLLAWLEINMQTLRCRLAAAVRGTQDAACAASPMPPIAQAEEATVTIATPPGRTGACGVTVSLTQLKTCGVTLRHLVELHDVCRRLPEVDAAKEASDDVWRCLCLFINTTLKQYCDDLEVGGDVVVDHAEAIETLAVAHELLPQQQQHRGAHTLVQHTIDTTWLHKAEHKYRYASSRWRAAVLAVRTLRRTSGSLTVAMICVLLCVQHLVALPAMATAEAAICVGLGGLSSAVLAQLEYGPMPYTRFALQTVQQAIDVVTGLAVDVLAAVKQAVSVAVMQRHASLLHTEAILALSLLDFVPDPSWPLPARIWEALQEMSEYDMLDLDGCLTAVADAARRALTVVAHPLELGAGWAVENALDYVRLCRERAAALGAYFAHLATSSGAGRGGGVRQRDTQREALSASGAAHDKLAAAGHNEHCSNSPYDPRLCLRVDAVRCCLGALRAGGYEEVILQDIHAVGRQLRQGGLTAMDAVLLDDKDTVRSPLDELVTVVVNAVLDCAATVLPFLAVATTYVTRHAEALRERQTTKGRDGEGDDSAVTMVAQSYVAVSRLREFTREHRIFADDICALHLGDVQAPCNLRVAARRLRYLSRSAYRYPQALARLARLRRAVPTPPTTQVASFAGGGWRVTFDHVWFRYPGTTRYVLRDISFFADPATRLGIVGESGSGKSTLLLLAAGVYAPTSGQIWLNGIPIAHYPARELRRRIASAWQPDAAPRFFDELSVECNVALGALPDATPTTVRRALAEAQVLRAMGDRGVDALRTPLLAAQYSGGELDRLCVARCLVKPAARTGLFLLDECTAALDSVTERRVMDAVRGRGATALLVSHRLASLRDTDALLLLRDGRVVGHGRWDELLRETSGGYFRALYDAQRLPGEG